MTLGTTKVRRSVSFLTYLCFTIAGVSAIVSPPLTMTSTTGTAVVVAWSLLMVIGGGAGMYSALTENVLTEWFGLPALVGAMLVYIIAIGVRIAHGSPNVSGLVVTGLILLGLSGRMIMRALDLRDLIKAVRERP